MIGMVLHGMRTLRVEVTAEPAAEFTIRDPRGILPANGPREVGVRVRSALAQIGIVAPGVCVTLRPTWVEPIRPAGTTGLDLPVALAALACLGKAPGLPAGLVAVGELSLIGEIRPVRGVTLLHEALGAERDAVFPAASGWEAPGRHVARGLGDVLAHYAGGAKMPVGVTPPPRAGGLSSEAWHPAGGDILAAVDAGHTVLLAYSRGVTRLRVAHGVADALSARQPDLSEAARIFSLAGLLTAPLRGVPFRAPHHTVSEAGMLGGGNPVRPGEVSLATGGVLCLDEAHEWRRSVLAQTLETTKRGRIELARGGLSVSFPAKPVAVIGTAPAELPEARLAELGFDKIIRID